jgi:threonine aldolase
MRFISAQFIAYFENELWKKNAQHANNMAQKLAKEIQSIQPIKITMPVEVNSVFAEIPHYWTEPLKKKFFFYTWNHIRNEVRWMCSFDTTDEDIKQFTDLLRKFSQSE